MRSILAATLMLSTAALSGAALADTPDPRPLFLIDLMAPGPLKDKLAACSGQPMQRTLFSIGHRGAPLMFAEHTVESNRAAARMGAGILECDVTFTKDKELVCRHAQNDLHTSTNILATDLAATCITPFTPASGDAKATAECRTSEVTLEQFRTLKGKMDGADATATTLDAFMNGSPRWRTDLYATEAGTLMTHAESIQLFKSLGAKFTPELKSPSVEMPFDGFSQEAYAQKMIDEYKAAGIPASDVWAQSFNLDDVLYWIKAEPEFGKQAVYLIDADEIDGFDNMKPETWGHDMADLHGKGLNYIAPPLFVLVTLEDGKIVPSAYAKAAKDAGLKIITWSLERSGPLNAGGGGYYKTITPAVTGSGVMYELVDVLAQQVGVVGIFSDWPGTVTYYANCMGL
ncbi:MAG: glycerophosphodiester phosphodiesterase [Rhodobacter sp.]|nr:glycerophosphodiester phosphodiesterase [Rhodobacter sp.]